MNYLDLQNAVKRDAIRDKSGTTYDAAIKDIINRALFRISRESAWRSLRRKTYFTTKDSYTTGSGAGLYHLDSNTINVTGATFLTDDINIGRRIKLSGDANYFNILNVTSETAITLDSTYSGATTNVGTYEILGQEEYNLPIQSSHRMFMWHEAYGYPYMMNYVTDQDFYGYGVQNVTKGVPIAYRMWGEDMVIEQLRDGSTLNIASSDATDTAINVTIFGTVSGYPDFQTVATDSSDGTTTVYTTKTFTAIERVTKSASTAGRITLTANSGATTVAVLPVGDSTDGIRYRKLQLYPLPNEVYNINVQYYKDPFALVNDTDVHELGPDFDQAIIFLAVALLKYQNNQDEGDKFMLMYKDEIRNLRKTNVDKIDWLPTLRRPRNSRPNNVINPNIGISPLQVGPYYGWGNW